MGYVFWLLGGCIFMYTFTLSASSSIHQIYVQLLYITSFLLMGCGQIIITLSRKLSDMNNKFEAIEAHLQRILERF
jgi:hypothetical protein